jgi:hypothetical protein
MGRLVINNAMTVNGAFEAPSPEEWLVLDPDSNTVSLEQLLVADAMVLGRKTLRGPGRGLATIGGRLDLGAVRGPAEQHAQVRGVQDPARAVDMERHPSRRRLGRERDRPQGPPQQDPDRLRCRRAGPCPRGRGPRGRVLVLGESVSVGDRTADLRWCRSAPPGADRVDDIPFRRAATGLPASARPVGRCDEPDVRV